MKHEFNASQVLNVTWLTRRQIIDASDTDCAVLFEQYAYYANLQKTNQPRVKTRDLEDTLKWGRDKVQKVRNKLEGIGFIEVVKKRSSGQFPTHFIKVNHLISYAKMQSLPQPENTFVVPRTENTVTENTFATSKIINNLKDIEEEDDKAKTFTTGKVDTTTVVDIAGVKEERKPALDTKPKASNQSNDVTVNTIIAHAKEAWIDQPEERITPVTKEHIKKRLAEGFTLKDFKKAIDDSYLWSRTTPRTLAVLTKSKSTFNGFVTWQDRTPEMYDRYGRNYSE